MTAPEPNNAVRILFAGSGEFAVPCWMALRQFCLDQPGHQVVGVLTQPPGRAGRGLKWQASPLQRHLEATHSNVAIFSPPILRETAEEILEQANPDLIIVVDYGQFIPDSWLTAPRHGCLNIHPSLLPRWRGAIPIQAVLLAGDEKTGVTLQKMIKKMDAGPLIDQVEINIEPNETAGELHQRLSVRAARQLIDTLPKWLAGEVTPQEQSEAEATYCYAEELSKENAQLAWTDDGATLANKIRALSPDPVAWTTFRGKRLRIRQANIAGNGANRLKPGQLAVNDKRLLVGTGTQPLQFLTLQLEGKPQVDAISFINGYHPGSQDVLGESLPDDSD